MLKLFLMRHAKAAQARAGQMDYDRPLTARGEAAAAAVGRAMAERGYLPDMVICSAARRTRETLAGVLPDLAQNCRIDLKSSLYPLGDYLPEIRQVPDDVHRLLLVGHNPAVHDLALTLAGTGERDLLVRLAQGYPTGVLAVISFAATHWADISPDSGQIDDLLVPADLGVGGD